MANREWTAGPAGRRCLVVLVALTLAVGGCAAPGAPTTEPVGGVAPTESAPAPSQTSAAVAVPASLRFSADLVAGGRFEGATLTGRPVVVWFWAAWCPRCRAKAGDVKATYTEFGTKVAFVGVAGLGSGTDAMRSFVDQYGLTGFPQLADDTGTVWRHFGVVEQEYFVVIDAAGNIVHKGPLTTDALRDRVRTLAN